jgi:thiol-disulfide isomerase/thioredoxin
MQYQFKVSLVSILFTLSLLLPPSQSIAMPKMPIVDLSDYKGKVVYLDFWASWCIPCRKSFPWMNKQLKNFSSDDLVIIAVNLDKKRELAEQFLADNPAEFNIVYDPKGQLAKFLKIQGMPSSVIFDRQGNPITAHTGFFEKKIEQYESELSKAITNDQ